MSDYTLEVIGGQQTLEVIGGTQLQTLEREPLQTLEGGIQGPPGLPGPALPAGAPNGSVLFADGGAAAWSPSISYDKATGTFTVKKAVFGNGTITATNPVVSATQTWNSAAVAFTAALVNVTDQASNFASKLLDLQVGGGSVFSFRKDGQLALGGTQPTLELFPASPDVYKIYRSGTSIVHDSAGFHTFRNSTTQVFGTFTDQFIVYTSMRSASGTLDLRQGTSAQLFRVSNTYTDASNREQLELGFNGTNTALIRATASGTGTVRPMQFSAASFAFAVAGTAAWNIGTTGHLTAATDNTYDIGAASGTRPRSLYLSSSAYINAAGTNSVAGNAVPALTIYGGNGLPSYAGEVRFQSLDGVSTMGQVLMSSGGLTFSTGTSALSARWLMDRGAGHFTPGQDNTYDIGSATVRPRFIYAANAMLTPALALQSTGTQTAYLYAGADQFQALELRNGPSLSGAFRVYNFYTDASNYERGFFRWSGNVLQIGAEAAGTGVARPVSILANGMTIGTSTSNDLIFATNGATKWYIQPSGHYLAFTDNTADIGQPTFARPRSGYFGTTVQTPRLQYSSQLVMGLNATTTDVLLGTGAMILGAGHYLGWSDTVSNAASGVQDVRLYRDSANMLALRNAAATQQFNIYSLYTDASNYARLAIGFLSAGYFRIGPQSLGTGPTMGLVLDGGPGNLWLDAGGIDRWIVASNTGSFMPALNNTYDLGAQPGNTVRTGYFSTAVGVNTTPSSSFHALGGGARFQALATPVIGNVTTTGTPGTTTYSYWVVAKDRWGNKTAVSVPFNMVTGSAVLDNTNFNTITWAAVPGAANYDVLKADTGHSIAVGITATTFDDKGGVSSVYAAPTRNATADLTVDGMATLDGLPIRYLSWALGNSFTIGSAASVVGTGATAVGTSSTAGSGATALGEASFAGGGAVALGRQANANGGSGNIAIGSGAVASGVNASIALGMQSVSDLTRTFAAGSTIDANLAIVDWYFGSSRIAAAPQSVTLNASGGSGTDIAGANITIAGGKPTGAGAGGSIFFSTAAAGVSGTTLRALSARWQIDGNTGALLPAVTDTTTLGTNAFRINTVWVGSGGVITPVLNLGNGLAYLQADAANAIAQRNGLNSQTFRVYNTYTDAANYERGFIGWSSNSLNIGTEAAGTGVNRTTRLSSGNAIAFAIGGADKWQLDSSGNLIATTDSSVDIGLSASQRPRSIYIANDFVSGGGVLRLQNSAAYVQLGGDITMVRDAANTLALRNSTSAQTLRVYNTYTDSVNYERASLQWTANEFLIQVGVAGTGINTRPIVMSAKGYSWRDPASAKTQAELVNGNTFNLYNSWTDASNYDRFTVTYASGAYFIGAEAAGTGTLQFLGIKAVGVTIRTNGVDSWQFNSSGHLFAFTDNTFNIGQPAGNRPQNVYVGTKVSTPNVQFPATQVPSADPNTLDDYEEGTFTPGVAFGGASTGITYTLTNGNYTKVGNRVDFRLYILMSNKGTATGVATITGLPFSSVGGGSMYQSSAPYTSGTSGLTSNVIGLIASSSSSILLYMGTDSKTQPTNANFTNATEICVSGTYFV
jgi:hypothetical protein